MYKVILKNHGIIEGSLLKNSEGSYSLEQYEIAKNNGKGLQGAIDFADKNGYKGLIMPKGIYSFCYEKSPSSIGYNNYVALLRSNQEYDLGGATFEMIFDSVNKSPYHTVDEPAWKLGGTLLFTKNCINIKIRNGELKGDIYNRSFSDGGTGFASEAGIEKTLGIRVAANSFNVTIENINVHGFMSDGISMSTRGFTYADTFMFVVPPEVTSGFYNSTGDLETRTGAYYSTAISKIDREKLKRLSPNNPNILQIQTSGGYNRVPRLENNGIEILYFDENDNFIKKRTHKYLDHLILPPNATGIRFQFTNEESTFTIKGLALTQPASNNITIRNCKIHDNHRGGISNCADNTIIEDNEIYNNGMDSSIGAPLFPDTTRYAINCEDSVSVKVTIRNNNIYNHFNGMLIGCYTAEIYGNTVSNSAGVYVVSNFSTRVSNNNFFESSALGVASSREPQTIIFENNIIVNKYAQINANIDENRAEIYYKNNVIKAPLIRLKSDGTSKLYIKDNDITITEKYVNTSPQSEFNCTLFERNKIKSETTANRLVTILSDESRENEYVDLTIRLSFKNLSKITINREYFKGCYIEAFVDYNIIADKQLVFRNTLFRDTEVIMPSGYNSTVTDTFKSSLLIERSDIDIYSKVFIKSRSYASQNINYEIKIKDSIIQYFVEPNPNLTSGFSSPMTIEIT